MIKLLNVISGLNNAGTESVVMNYLRNMDKTQIVQDFLGLNTEKGYYEEEIKSLDGKYKTEHINLFVNTSDNEGIPVSIMEAQQFGIPAIARNVGGNREIILEELLLPSDVTPEIIADLIKKYAQKPRACIEEIRNKCREKVELEYNAVVNTKKFCKQLLMGKG